MSSADFYSNTNSQENRFIIMGKSAVGNTDYFFRSYTSLLVFDNLSEQDKQFNEEYLRSQNAYFTYGDEIHENSLYLIYQDLKRFYPLITCVALVVLIGIISFACIVFKHSQRDNGIYFMCGNTRFGSMKILMGELTIILLLSGLLTVSAFWFSDYKGIFEGSKLTFTSGNILITLLAIVLLMVCMIFIPYISYRKNSPIEIIRRSL
jgi:ABC-type antimicrobial peptide transport system permease subunit